MLPLIIGLKLLVGGGANDPQGTGPNQHIFSRPKRMVSSPVLIPTTHNQYQSLVGGRVYDGVLIGLAATYVYSRILERKDVVSLSLVKAGGERFYGT